MLWCALLNLSECFSPPEPLVVHTEAQSRKCDPLRGCTQLASVAPASNWGGKVARSGTFCNPHDTDTDSNLDSF